MHDGQHRRRQRAASLAILIPLAAAAAAALVGCAGEPSAGQRAATLKAAGVDPAVRQAAAARTAVVATGHGLHVQRTVLNQYATRSFTLLTVQDGLQTSDDTPGSRGCAAAIDRRGYYLTAAHAVGSDPLFIVGGGAIRPARVVFRGDADFDLAILAVDRPISDPFEWATDDQCRPGAAVLESGAANVEANFDTELFAGHVGQVEPAEGRDGPYDVVTSDLPARHGDSGGPVMTADGRLVGIFVRFNPFVTRAAAIRPRAAWVRDVVERDHNAYRSGAGLPSATTRTSAQ